MSASAGLILDCWQADCVHDVLAIGEDGKWICFECGVIVARQNGKGAILECLALAGLYLLGERLIMWSAHEYKTAMEGFRRVRALVENTDDLRRRVKRISNTNGEESIELHGEGRHRITGGQRLRFLARSKGSGRGFSGVRNLIDEAYAYTEDQKSALMPTMSAMPNPQIVYASSPPLDAATGEPLFALRERAETGLDPSLGWLDWAETIDLDDEVDSKRVYDVETWRRTNPAMPHRVSIEHVVREARGMSLTSFARERLCVYPKRAGDGVIDLKQWARLADECAGDLCPDEVDDGAILSPCRHGPLTDLAFVVDVTPSRDYASIGLAAMRPDGLEHWELVDYRRGTDWVVARLVSLVDAHAPVGVGLDPAGPAGSLLGALRAAGIDEPEDPEKPERGQLLVMSTREVTQATGDMIDAVRQDRGRHIDQAELNLAVKGAKTRPVGDAVAWGRRVAAVDISPLVAITHARHVRAVRAPLVVDDEGEPGAWFM